MLICDTKINQITRNVFEKLKKGDFQKYENGSWAAYHASLQNELSQDISLEAKLPLFKTKAHSPAMVRHSMAIVRDAVQFLNPGQIPAVTFDQHLYALPSKCNGTGQINLVNTNLW